MLPRLRVLRVLRKGGPFHYSISIPNHQTATLNSISSPLSPRLVAVNISISAESLSTLQQIICAGGEIRCRHQVKLFIFVDFALMARYPGHHPKVQCSSCTVDVRRMLPIMKLLLVSLAVVLWASEAQVDARKQSPPLRFNKNGEFKIVQVADMHYANGATTACQDVLPSQVKTCSDLNTTAFLYRVIAEEKPDLLLFTGDNIMQMDSSDPVASLKMAFAPAIATKTPWAAVLGNHDQEGPLPREGVMKYIVGMDYTLSRVNPHGSCSKIDGFGNYNLEVFGTEGSPLEDKSVLNLYMVDSGDYNNLTAPVSYYGWIHETQSAWIKKLAMKLQWSYKREAPAQPQPAPALAYFHIPLPEYKLLYPNNFTGIKQEAISSAAINSGYLTTLLEIGDVKAAFVGHDHVNDFCGDVAGLKLCYAGGFGYHAYGLAGWDRRTRVVVASLAKNKKGAFEDVSRIVTWKRLDNKHFTKIDTETLWRKTATTL